MKYHFQLFPHISRLFPVWLLSLGEQFLLVALIVSFFLAHIYASNTIKNPCCTPPVFGVLKNPYDLEAKLALARFYWQHGQKTEAKKEIEIVKDMLHIKDMQETNSNSLVLGAMASKLEDTLRAFHPESQKINSEESFWKKIIEERPDYRDGYVILALLSYKKKSTDMAAFYKNKALSLDPNYPLPKELFSLK
ncbi:hypothetical protein HY947_00130 [Candidatus Gottesmanbacteria bacterium]|nr:hypothetical protein [Candidatus Gottesmanbacteria bacterium]